MKKCVYCSSMAINPTLPSCGRDGSNTDLCDVCYWRKRGDTKFAKAIEDQLKLTAIYEKHLIGGEL